MNLRIQIFTTVAACLLFAHTSFAEASQNRGNDKDERRKAAKKFLDPALATFEELRAKGRTWLPGMPMPETLEQAGLGADWHVAWTDMYFDGGTRGFLIVSGEDRFLAFCTGPGLEHPPGRTLGEPAPVGSRLFIGATHYTHKEARPVPAGSAAEAFLRSLMAKKSGSTTSGPAQETERK